MSPPPLSAGQRARIRAHTAALIEQANRALGLHLPPIPVRFDVHGAAWGYYVRRGTQCLIRYNPWLFARHFQTGLQDTVPHEVAHYVVDHSCPRGTRPHGPEWKRVMALFGIPDARATHRTDLEGVPVRRQRRFLYTCACGERELSATRHYRQQRGQAQYQCRCCRQPLAWTGREA